MGTVYCDFYIIAHWGNVTGFIHPLFYEGHLECFPFGNMGIATMNIFLHVSI